MSWIDVPRQLLSSGRWLILLCVGTLFSCAPALFTAPPGSTFTCFANPPFIAAFGDVTVVSALIIQPSGSPVPDGTDVQFFSTLGRIDSQGRTKDGVARVNLVSDSRSGSATVTAVSGGPAVAPSASPSGGGGTGSGSCSTTVTIGSARPAKVVVVANPPRLGSNRCTTVVANVFDANGNPVFNVPIIFSVGSPTSEFFEGGSSPIFTDTNGQSSDVMCTRRPRDDPQTTVTVTATAPNGISNTYKVTIN